MGNPKVIPCLDFSRRKLDYRPISKHGVLVVLRAANGRVELGDMKERNLLRHRTNAYLELPPHPIVGKHEIRIGI